MPKNGPTFTIAREYDSTASKGPKMPKLRRRLTILALSLLAGLLMLPAAGQAATVFGSPLRHAPIRAIAR